MSGQGFVSICLKKMYSQRRKVSNKTNETQGQERDTFHGSKTSFDVHKLH